MLYVQKDTYQIVYSGYSFGVKVGRHSLLYFKYVSFRPLYLVSNETLSSKKLKYKRVGLFNISAKDFRLSIE